MSEIQKYLDWLLKENLINPLQYSEASDWASFMKIAIRFSKVGYNPRDEFDR